MTTFFRLACLVFTLILTFVPPGFAQTIDGKPVGVAVNIKAVGINFTAAFQNPTWGNYSFQIYAMNGSHSGTATYPATETNQVTAQLEPGRTYYLSVNAAYTNLFHSIQAVPPPGYTIEMNGSPRERISFPDVNDPLFGSDDYWSGVTLRLVSQFNGRAGTATALAGGQINWQASLGYLSDGSPAGSVAIVDRGNVDISSLFNSTGFIYNGNASDVKIVYNNGQDPAYVPGTIRQIIAPQACADIVVTSPVHAEVKFYHPGQIASQNGNSVYIFGGDPFAWYIISGGTANTITIDCDTRELDGWQSVGLPVVRTKRTVLTRTGTEPDFTWTADDWYDGSTSLSRSTQVRSGTNVTTTSGSPGGPTVTQGSRSSGTMAWGEETVSETRGTTNPVTTTYDYYTSSAQSASYGKPRSIATTGGGWIGYEYYDYTGNFENDRAAGAVHKIHRPYKNSDTSVPPNLATHTAGEITTFQYAPDAFGRGSRPSLIETAVNGVVTARAEIAYSDSSANFPGHPMLYVVTATRQDSTGSGGALTSIKKYFREDAIMSFYYNPLPGLNYDRFFRLKTHSLQEPDGQKKSYVYQRGTWNSGSGFIPSANGGTNYDKSSRICVISGSATTTGSLYTSYEGYDVDDLYLVADKSTLEVTIRDQHALVRRTESHVWHGGDWHLVSAVDYTYNYANQLTSRVSSNGGTHESAWSGELKQWEKDESGVKISYTEYDAAGRVKLMTRESGGAIAAVTTRLTYDANDQVTESRVGWGLAENLVTSFGYDDAGRLTSQTPPGLGATSYSYNPSARTKTTTFPDTGTRVETFYADGRLASVTGTSVVEEHYAYDLETDGRRHIQVRAGSSTSSRLSEMWTDWLGRTKKTSKPGWTGQPNFVVENIYATGTGLIEKTTQTGYAPTRYEYDSLGRLLRSGLDIGDDGLVLNSTDRISDADRSFEYIENAWWLREETKTYPFANGTAVTTSVSRMRLTGHPAGRLGETRVTDAEANTSVTTVDVNRATKTTTVTTTHPGLNNQTETLVNGFTTSVTGSDGLTFTKAYDSLTRPSSVTDPRIGATMTAYYAGTVLPQSVTAAAGLLYSCAYDTSGRKTLHTDAAGKNTRYAYNLRGQLYREWGDGTYPVEHGYDTTYGDRTTVSTYRSAPATDSATWPAVGTADTTTFTYDTATGLLSKKTDAAAKFVEFTYNQRGQTYQRLWSRTYGGNRVATTYAYDGNTGELTGVSYNDTTPSVSYTYTRMGQTKTASDGITGLNTFDYDATKPWRLSSNTLSGFYGNRVLTALYEETGVVGRARGFQLGSAASHAADLEQSYGFSSGGRIETLTSQRATNAISRTFRYAYLANSSLVQALSVDNVSDSANNFTVTRGYESNRDLLASIDSKWGTTSQTRYDYTHNALYQRETTKQSGAAFADYGDSTFSRYTYDARGQLTAAPVYLGSTVTDLSKPLPGRQHSFDYDSIGNRKWADRTGSSAQREDYTPNALNQYTNKENHSIAVQGTVDSVNTTVAVTGSAETSRQARYWAAEASVGNSSGPWRGDLSIHAAKVGAGSGGSDLVRTDIRPAQLAAALQAFTYDDDGNMLSDGLWDYQWDAENRLIRMATNSVAVGAGFPNRVLSFRYDYLGRRVQKRVVDGGTSAEISSRRYLYTGWNLVAEFQAPGGTSVASLVRSYTWGLDLVGSLTASGGVGALVQIHDHSESKTLLPTYDGNGNIASLLNASTGAFEAIYEYDSSGQLLRAEGTYAKQNPFRFSTKFQDEETGLIYYGYRYYSSSLGRFINRDPIAEAGGMNLYGFVANNSINSIDYLGLNDEYTKFGSFNVSFYFNGYEQKPSEGAMNLVAISDSLARQQARNASSSSALNGSQFTSSGASSGSASSSQGSAGINNASGEFLPNAYSEAEPLRFIEFLDDYPDGSRSIISSLAPNSLEFSDNGWIYGGRMVVGDEFREGPGWAVNINSGAVQYFGRPAHTSDPLKDVFDLLTLASVVRGVASIGYRSAVGFSEGLFGVAETTAMRAGQLAEGPALQAIGSTGKVTFTPTAAQIDSAAFKVIVGDAKYTASGTPVSTIFDGSTAAGLAEIKHGSSMLTSTYQLRLQTYASLVSQQSLTIYTTRPIGAAFGEWLSRWGVSVKPLP